MLSSTCIAKFIPDCSLAIIERIMCDTLLSLTNFSSSIIHTISKHERRITFSANVCSSLSFVTQYTMSYDVNKALSLTVVKWQKTFTDDWWSFLKYSEGLFESTLCCFSKCFLVEVSNSH